MPIVCGIDYISPLCIHNKPYSRHKNTNGRKYRDEVFLFMREIESVSLRVWEAEVTISGVALLAICTLLGGYLGDLLGAMLGVKANVGGVGIAMLLLIAARLWLVRHGHFSHGLRLGVEFWGSTRATHDRTFCQTFVKRTALNSPICRHDTAVLPPGIPCIHGIPRHHAVPVERPLSGS